jgi:hypothetical protein
MTKIDLWCGLVAIAMAGLIGLAPLIVARLLEPAGSSYRMPVEWSVPALPIERRA